MVYPWLQAPQGESVAQPGTLLLIIFSVVYKSDIKEAIVYHPIRC